MLKGITVNPARILRLDRKGEIKENKDADFCLLNSENLTLDMVIAKGRIMVQDGEPIVFGTFEGK